MISLRDIITEKRATIPDDEVKERSWILVFRYNPSLEILLARDDEGDWSFPGGQLNDREQAEDAAWRELKEETGISPEKLHFLKTIYHDKPNKLKVSHIFYTEVKKDIQLKALSDVEKLKWYRINELPNLSKPKQDAIASASEIVRNPKKELDEHISLFSAMGYTMPQFCLIEEKKRTAKGFLIVFEGIDGVGKTTQRKNLKNWLENKGWKVTSSKWGASPTISKLIKIGKVKKWLSPMLFSLLNASDMIWRYENEIKPALDKGHIVLCDRYYYTSYVRDKLRGIQTEMLDHIYDNFMEPDLVVHFQVDPRMAVERLLRDKGFKWYSSGMDIGYSGDLEECALTYETNMDTEYRRLLPKSKNYKFVNTGRSIDEIFEELKEFVRDRVDAARKQRLNEGTGAPGNANGWLEPNGVCHYVSTTHSDWASRKFGVPIPRETDPGYLRAALKLNKMMSAKGWVVIVISPSQDKLFVDAGEISWGHLTRAQKEWIDEVSYMGYGRSGDRLVASGTPRNPPLKIVALINGKEYSPSNLQEEKLSWAGMMKEVLLERMSFAALYNKSDPTRIKRSDNVRVKPMRVTTIDGNEAWTFKYKSYPSTTGNPWQGYIQFFKDDVSGKESAGELDCMVDCSCPDYRYRWAYANTKQDASRIGAGSLNQCNDAPPNKTNPGQVPGMCKHLIALGEYLKTNIEPNAPEPDDEPIRPMYEPQRVKPMVKKQPATVVTPSIEAPTPDDITPDDEIDTYSDTRSGTLTEGGSGLYQRLDSFAKNTPEFDVMYDDETE